MRNQRWINQPGRFGFARVGLRLAATITTAVALTLGAAMPAAATPASFDPLFGFLPGGLEGLDEATVSILPEDFLMAGEETEPNLDIELQGSTNLCILAGSNTCQSNLLNVSTSYSVLVTFTVSAINNASVSGPFTLFLSGISPNGVYGADEVTVELDQAASAGLNPAGFAGGDFRAFTKIIDEDPAGQGDPFFYIGWVVEVGDMISFKYDVLNAPDGRVPPQMSANAIALPVPEPGTAVLLGLGLLGLSRRSSAATR